MSGYHAPTNPYDANGLWGQCTWFAWGRFYELYGYDPGFRGSGKDCAQQLYDAHSDEFELSDERDVKIKEYLESIRNILNTYDKRTFII